MTSIRERGEAARRYILETVEKQPGDLGRLAAQHLGISRQAVNRHLHLLVEEGVLIPQGQTRNRSYTLAPLAEWTGHYPITPGLEEDAVWRTDVVPHLGVLPQNVMDIWQYGFTEMFNNAKDHSGGTMISVFLSRTAAASQIAIMDNGIGIFKKIKNAFGLTDELHAILELSKGKLTTAPTGHTGEGIFFTSHMFDSFDIFSGGLYYTHKFGEAEGWLTEQSQPATGTVVWLKLNNHTSRTSTKIFKQFSSGPDDYRFAKTIVPVKLAQYGNERLVSRSQAKRVVARVEQFSTVVLDFKGVDYIGQAFADEVFRVFAAHHPEVRIFAVNGSTEVKQMIDRVKSAETPS